MLINFSNHPSEYWSKKQLEAAAIYGTINDISFPAVEPEAEENEISSLAEHYTKIICDVLSKVENSELSAVHIMGELSLCFSLVIRLQKLNIKCLCSTSKRIVSADNSNNKISQFSFQKFRFYEYHK